MVADLSVVIVPLGLVGIKYINNNYLEVLNLKDMLTFLFCVLYFNDCIFINFPWIHPYDQKKQNYNLNEFNKLEVR